MDAFDIVIVDDHSIVLVDDLLMPILRAQMSWRNCYSEEISIKLTEDRFAPRSVNTGVWGSLMNERISMECKVWF